MPDTERRIDVTTIAEDFLNHFHPNDWARRDTPIEDTGIYSIAPDKVTALAENILDLVANIVASILDAGSERDAVNENETLLAEITNELRGWTEP